MHQFQKGELAYVAPDAILVADLLPGDLVQVVGRDIDPNIPVCVKILLRNGVYNKYAEHVPPYLNGYWMRDRELILVQLETEAVREAQTDVPLAEGELPKP